MGYKLSTRSLNGFFKNLPEVRVSEDNIALGYDINAGSEEVRELLPIFMRVLKAERPSEVADIPDDTIISMFGVLTELCDCLVIDDRFTNGDFQKQFETIRGISRKRRVL